MDGLVTDIIVPDNYVFALGDNRSNSSDCRRFGCIPLNKIEGKIENIAVKTIDKDNAGVSSEGLDFVRKMAGLTSEKINYRNNIRNFSGIRAQADIDDFIIGESKVKGFINFAGEYKVECYFNYITLINNKSFIRNSNSISRC